MLNRVRTNNHQQLQDLMWARWVDQSRLQRNAYDFFFLEHRIKTRSGSARPVLPAERLVLRTILGLIWSQFQCRYGSLEQGIAPNSTSQVRL